MKIILRIKTLKKTKREGKCEGWERKGKEDVYDRLQRAEGSYIAAYITHFTSINACVWL